MSDFRFKKFSIQQDLCAMKVGTDGVLLGAWVDVKNRKNALDIGSGTGLISLMMAQRNEYIQIKAIEIDPAASGQCLVNFENSPWKDRLSIDNISFQEFNQSETILWDLIVCNPPYFQSGMLSDSDLRNTARHASSLSAEDLFDIAKDKCSGDCIFAIIIPKDIELQYCRVANERGWYLKKKTDVITTIGKAPQRVLLEFILTITTEVTTDCLVVELGARNVWSDEYKNITREFHIML